MMVVTSYEELRPSLRPGMVVFYSTNTAGWKRATNFIQWRIQRGQTPPSECDHVGLLDIVRERVVTIEATPPRVRVAPLSAGLDVSRDGRYSKPFDGRIWIGDFAGADGDLATVRAWDNLLLPYDYLDLASIRLGITHRNDRKYICSELVADAIEGSGGTLTPPGKGSIHSPGDLFRAARILWRIR